MRRGLLLLLLASAVCLVYFRQPALAGEPKKFLHQGRERHYRLYKPNNLQTRPALVLALHGGGGTARYMERHSGFTKLADRDGFLVVFPEGVEKQWNDGREGEFTTAHKDKVDDVGFLTALVAQLSEQYQVDSEKVFATGISNGGFMSSRLAAEASQTFRAIAPVVAGIPASWAGRMQLQRPVSVMILQGTDDPLVPYHGGYVQVGKKKRGRMLSTLEAVEKWRSLNGCPRQPQVETLPDLDPNDGCTITRFRYHGGREGSRVELWRVDGGGHTWPGGSQYLPQRVVGKVCRDIDASQEIWRFFQGQTSPL